MSSSIVDRLNGYRAALAFKAPCRVATTGPITLSGLQSVAGETVAEGDRVAVKDQASKIENGIYIAAVGAWKRARDFDGHDDVARGTRVYCYEGSNGPAEYEVTTSDPVIVGTSEIEFDYANDSISSAVAAAASAAQSAASAAEAAATLDEVYEVRDDVANIQDQAVAAAEASGDIVFFDTKAAANASLAALADNTVIEVFADESKGGARTRYRKQSGVYSFKLTLGYDGEAPLFVTRTQALLATIPAAIGAFRTLGRSSAGDGGGAIYIRKTASTLLDGTDAAGGQWSLDAGQQINAQMFGAVGDGTFNTSTGAMGGTDDTAALQAMVDWALQSSVADVFLADRYYRITNTLHLGYGNAFYSIRLHGTFQGSYKAGAAGSALLYDGSADRSAINIQGGRDCAVRGVGLIGKNYLHPINNRVSPGDYSRTPADWLDATLAKSGSNPGGLQQHSPYAGITIDAFSAAAPSDAYPTVTYPAWTGLSTQYSKALSSGTIIENNCIVGFAVGVCESPNSDLQGDYLGVINNWFFSHVYAIAVGNAQSRNVRIESNKYFFLHSFIDGLTFGAGTGVLAGTVTNNSGSSSYQVLQVNCGYFGPLTIDRHYFEIHVRLGEVGSGVVGTIYPVIFESCKFNFGQLATGQIPASLITGASQQQLTVRNCHFKGISRIVNLFQGQVAVIWENNNLTPELYGITGATYGHAAFQTAINYCGGVFINGSHLSGGGEASISPLEVNGYTVGPYLATATSSPLGGSAIQLMGKNIRFYAGGSLRARRVRSQGAVGFVDTNNRQWHFEGHLCVPTSLSSIVSVSPAFTNDEMTFTISNTLQDRSVYRLLPGDIIYHAPTGTVFVVKTIGAADGSGNWPITCIQQNNLMVTKDGNATYVSNLCSDLTLAGVSVIHHTAHVLPAQVEYATFTSGSPNIASIHRGDNFAGDLATHLAVGDPLMGLNFNGTASLWPVPLSGKAQLSTVTAGSPGSAVMTANAVCSGVFPLYPIPIR